MHSADLEDNCGESFNGLSVIDIGCNTGFWSIKAKKVGARTVLGIDGKKELIEQAGFVRDTLKIDGVRFRHMDVYDVSKDSVGQFDICLFLGVLYHLDDPILALQKMAEITKRIIVVDTTVVPFEALLLVMRYEDPSDPRMSTRGNMVFVPTPITVEWMLEYVGFRNIHQTPIKTKDLPREYLNGRRISIMATAPTESVAQVVASKWKRFDSAEIIEQAVVSRMSFWEFLKRKARNRLLKRK